MTTKDAKSSLSINFESVLQVDVPTGRKGKHAEIISQLLHDLTQLKPGSAVRVRLEELPDTKENIRSALNRVTREKGMHVATSSDDDYLYLWKPE